MLKSTVRFFPFLVSVCLACLTVFALLPGPTLESIFPTGGIRVTTFELILNGRNLDGATVSFDGNGITGLPPPDEFSFRGRIIAVATDAPLGPQNLDRRDAIWIDEHMRPKACGF